MVPQSPAERKQHTKTLMDNIGVNISHVLDALGWSQRELSRACGEEPQFISRLITGQERRAANIGAVYRIAAALDLSLDDFVARKIRPAEAKAAAKRITARTW
jgi:transcriptional regulator with XRE-family HTH domain